MQSNALLLRGIICLRMGMQPNAMKSLSKRQRAIINWFPSKPCIEACIVQSSGINDGVQCTSTERCRRQKDNDSDCSQWVRPIIQDDTCMLQGDDDGDNVKQTYLDSDDVRQSHNWTSVLSKWMKITNQIISKLHLCICAFAVRRLNDDYMHWNASHVPSCEHHIRRMQLVYCHIKKYNRLDDVVSTLSAIQLTRTSMTAWLMSYID